MPIDFPYYYGAESEQFSFYRIPKLLFTDSRFSSISTNAKLLYGMLLDRMSLSAKNGWYDAQGRVYIIFSIEDVTEVLGFKTDTVIKSTVYARIRASTNTMGSGRRNESGP